MAIEYWDGGKDYWSQSNKGTGMDVAVGEIVDHLDGTPFPYPGVEGVRTLEVIVAFHASHTRNAAWTRLPLVGDDRNIPVNSG